MKNIYEILEEFNKASSYEEKQNVLRKNYNSVLENVLRQTYSKTIEYVINKVPYYKPDTESPIGMSYSNMANEIRRIYMFEKNNPKTSKNLTDKRKEELLTQSLESLEAKEAIVFMNIILKKDLTAGLNYDFVKKTFPNLNI